MGFKRSTTLGFVGGFMSLALLVLLAAVGAPPIMAVFAMAPIAVIAFVVMVEDSRAELDRRKK